MKTVSVREVQHQLSAILDRVQRGEHVTITRRGRVIARLVPASARSGKNVEWPDFGARMKRLFPAGPPPGEPASEIIRRTREERF